MKLSEDRKILFLEPAAKAKMLSFVLPTEKCLVVSFGHFFKFHCNHGELEEPRPPKFFVDAGGIFLK